MREVELQLGNAGEIRFAGWSNGELQSGIRDLGQYRAESPMRAEIALPHKRRIETRRPGGFIGGGRRHPCFIQSNPPDLDYACDHPRSSSSAARISCWHARR